MRKKNPSILTKQLYLFYTEDGFIDLAIGFVILFFGLSLAVDLPWIVGIASILPVLGWYIAKEKITQKRTGIIDQQASMKQRFNKFYIALVLFGILIFVLVITSILKGSPILLQYPLSIFGLVLASGISILAILLHTSRFYIHAAIILIAMTIGENLNSYFHSIDTYILATIIASIAILCIGIFVTSRFLKKYPIIDTRKIN